MPDRHGGLLAAAARQRYNPDGHQEITHRCPVPFAEGGDGTMPCCGRTPFEVPPYHRITLHGELVTCQGMTAERGRGGVSLSPAPAAQDVPAGVPAPAGTHPHPNGQAAHG